MLIKGSKKRLANTFYQQPYNAREGYQQNIASCKWVGLIQVVLVTSASHLILYKWLYSLYMMFPFKSMLIDKIRTYTSVCYKNMVDLYCFIVFIWFIWRRLAYTSVCSCYILTKSLFFFILLLQDMLVSAAFFFLKYKRQTTIQVSTYCVGVWCQTWGPFLFYSLFLEQP